MRTSKEYFADLKRMKPNLYIGGEKVGRDDPRIRPGIKVLSVTLDLAQNLEWEGLVTAKSSLTGINKGLDQLEDLSIKPTFGNSPVEE